MEQIEELYTPQDLAKLWKLHPTTIQRMFVDEPGVLVYGKEGRRDGKRQYITIRIPISVANSVYKRMSR